MTNKKYIEIITDLVKKATSKDESTGLIARINQFQNENDNLQPQEFQKQFTQEFGFIIDLMCKSSLSQKVNTIKVIQIIYFVCTVLAAFILLAYAYAE